MDERHAATAAATETRIKDAIITSIRDGAESIRFFGLAADETALWAGNQFPEIKTDTNGAGQYDIVAARSTLAMSADPAATLGELIGHVAPGGDALILELDVAEGSWFAESDGDAAFLTRMRDTILAAAETDGLDVAFGRKLAALTANLDATIERTQPIRHTGTADADAYLAALDRLPDSNDKRRLRDWLMTPGATWRGAAEYLATISLAAE